MLSPSFPLAKRSNLLSVSLTLTLLSLGGCSLSLDTESTMMDEVGGELPSGGDQAPLSGRQAGVEVAGVMTTSGVEVAGVMMTSGVEVAGVMAGAGVEVAGVTAGAGVEVAGIEVAGIEMAGVEVAGIEVAGVEVAGVEVAGVEPTCEPRAELCNGTDEDCDGVIDEGFIELGAPCFLGVGACRTEGALGCAESGSSLTCVAPELTPVEEVCDQADNDCDGVTDEGLAGCCTDGDVRACGSDVGSCTQSEQVCEGGSWSACDAQGPEAEVCDGADNDCDGRTDEGQLNACGGCGPVPAEFCDGADNDCDGRTDEGTLNACGACGAVPSEVCDNIDNDCDARLDENLTRNACSVGVGACQRSGIERCNTGSFVCDASAGTPTTEVCDALDNDCDGRLDENGSGGSLCDEVCNGQDEDNDGRIDEGVLNACGACGPVPVEVCDGGDNDCDGRTDEGTLNACGGCGPVPDELCDGEDNDCDGLIDEGFNVGASCGVGLGECFSSGTLVCEAGGRRAVCNALPRSPRAELCDALDNDCDGAVDETFDLNQDINNCGQCGRRCTLTADRCLDGMCFCGPAREICRFDTYCELSTCVPLCGEPGVLCDLP